MTDTNRHHNPHDRRDWSHIHEHILARAQKVRDGQGQLLLYSQFPDSPDVIARYPKLTRANQRGSFLRRPTS